MKSLSLPIIGVLFLSLVGFTQLAQSAPAEPSASPGAVTLQGTVIDNHCAGSQKAGDLAKFVKTHPKTCAIMPDCAASGYSIYSGGKLMKFDKISSSKILAFLQQPDSKTDVVVVAKKSGDLLSLESIRNE